jgi:protein-S-isoprenylcysteine O-methyltransferase Ste14
MVFIAALVALVLWGARLLIRVGKPIGSEQETTQLVTQGIYHAIRHPQYGSLSCLGWGIFFRSPSLLDGLLCGVATALLYATARAEENECLVRFGTAYADYMSTTKMFVPRLW